MTKKTDSRILHLTLSQGVWKWEKPHSNQEESRSAFRHGFVNNYSDKDFPNLRENSSVTSVNRFRSQGFFLNQTI